MRNGSAAIVPLFIGIMLLFWAIMFLGSGDDDLHAVTSATHLKRLQQKMIIPAAREAFRLERETNLTSEQIDAAVNAYVAAMMDKNQ